MMAWKGGGVFIRC